MLRCELDVKNKQIEDLTSANRDLTAALEHTTASLNAAQVLHAGTMQNNLLDNKKEETEGIKRKWWFLRKVFAQSKKD
jgi:hypothetical protein